MNSLKPKASPSLAWLAQLKLRGLISALDYHFAAGFANSEQAEALMIAAALLSAELNAGHICIDMPSLARRCQQWPLCPLAEYQQADYWLALLQHSAEVQQADAEPQAPKGASAKPLVLQYGRLYLHRYWSYERQIALYFAQTQPLEVYPAEQVAHYIQQLFNPDWQSLLSLKQSYAPAQIGHFVQQYLDVIDANSLSEQSLQRLLELDQPQSLAAWVADLPPSLRINWQQLAAIQACYQPRLVISGGPGTGKTTTVTRLLALLQQLQLAVSKPLLTIRLVAPTGKAAARLSESIISAKGQLHCSEQARASVPEQASTIHRLLGVIPGRAEFRHHADNPLNLDMLVVDEASMIDMPLMFKLLQALPKQARLILLGDKDQLASVEAGAVLGDLCRFIDHGYSAQLVDILQRSSGFALAAYTSDQPLAIADKLCLLRKSYRFAAHSGIGQLAQAVNQGRSEQALQLLDGEYSDLRHQPLNQQSYQGLIDEAVQAYRPYLEALKQGLAMEQVFAYFHDFQLLLALRQGELGVSGLNQRIEAQLHAQGLINRPSQDTSLWYAGRPVMIEQNDHEQQLYNGDIGICAVDQQGQLMVVFESADGLRWLLPSRLPAHQSVYAMTVHKSQGSEFKQVAMLLPPTAQGLVNRELLYTAITRAKSAFSLYADADSITMACRNKTQRRSGLVESLQQA